MVQIWMFSDKYSLRYTLLEKLMQNFDANPMLRKGGWTNNTNRRKDNWKDENYIPVGIKCRGMIINAPLNPSFTIRTRGLRRPELYRHESMKLRFQVPVNNNSIMWSHRICICFKSTGSL